MGEDFNLAFSPERVDPGREDWTTKTTPKILGGITPECTRRAADAYRKAIDTVHEVSTPEAAELTKLLENTFRSVNIGLANEMAIVCDKLGVNVWEVIDAAGTKPFGFMKFMPGPGLGGHCIPIDPHYLAWKMRGLNYKTRFIDVAAEVNSEMPVFWVRKVADRLNDHGKAVRGSRVLVVGVAYKKDIDDIRESPALDVLRLLRQLADIDAVFIHPEAITQQDTLLIHPGQYAASARRLEAGHLQPPQPLFIGGGGHRAPPPTRNAAPSPRHRAPHEHDFCGDRAMNAPVDPATLATRQYLYVMDNPNLGPQPNTRADKIGDAVSLGGGEFLVIERDDDALPEDDPAVIEKKLRELGLSKLAAEIIEPAGSPRLDAYTEEFFRLRQRKGVTRSEARDLMLDNNYFGAMMVRQGDADGFIAGLTQH